MKKSTIVIPMSMEDMMTLNIYCENHKLKRCAAIWEILNKTMLDLSSELSSGRVDMQFLVQHPVLLSDEDVYINIYLPLYASDLARFNSIKNLTGISLKYCVRYMLLREFYGG